MGLGGVVLAGAGIMMVVLVANNRWDATWNAMLGNGAASHIPGGASPPEQAAPSAGAGGSWS